METFPLQEKVPRTFAFEAMTAACSGASAARRPPDSEPWVEKMAIETYENKAEVIYFLDFIHRLYGFIPFNAFKDCFGYLFGVSSLA
jgi:hypothetical protein